MPKIIQPQSTSPYFDSFQPPVPIAARIAPTTNDLTSQLLPAVQRGYGLAERGALYAAQTEFVHVLRRIAQAKDGAEGSDQHSRALAVGLRALDEAEDFVPTGIQLEAELNVRIVASSHRTPVLKDRSEQVLPHQAIALYHSYAQEQLAQAVASEQAGSMALHGLGKIYALLAARQDEDVQFTQRATVMYAAALAARADNHLAANELGVLLCRNGRAAEAIPLFERTIDAAPTALAYHNLAVAQTKLGMRPQAAANEQESQRLAAWERVTGAVSRRAGVQWVAPDEMARMTPPATLTPAISRAATAPESAARAMAENAPSSHKSAWQRTKDIATSLPSIGSARKSLKPNSEVRVARPLDAPAAASQMQWR